MGAKCGSYLILELRNISTIPTVNDNNNCTYIVSEEWILPVIAMERLSKRMLLRFQ